MILLSQASTPRGERPNLHSGPQMCLTFPALPFKWTLPSPRAHSGRPSSCLTPSPHGLGGAWGRCGTSGRCCWLPSPHPDQVPKAKTRRCRQGGHCSGLPPITLTSYWTENVGGGQADAGIMTICIPQHVQIPLPCLPSSQGWVGSQMGDRPGAPISGRETKVTHRAICSWWTCGSQDRDRLRKFSTQDIFHGG